MSSLCQYTAHHSRPNTREFAEHCPLYVGFSEDRCKFRMHLNSNFTPFPAIEVFVRIPLQLYRNLYLKRVAFYSRATFIYWGESRARLGMQQKKKHTIYFSQEINL